jgi:hypothetical protein
LHTTIQGGVRVYLLAHHAHILWKYSCAEFSLFAYDSKLCKIDKAVILRAVLHTDDTYMNRGEVLETGVDADSLLEFVCCYPDIEMM